MYWFNDLTSKNKNSVANCAFNLRMLNNLSALYHRANDNTVYTCSQFGGWLDCHFLGISDTVIFPLTLWLYNYVLLSTLLLITYIILSIAHEK